MKHITNQEEVVSLEAVHAEACPLGEVPDVVADWSNCSGGHLGVAELEIIGEYYMTISYKWIRWYPNTK